MVVDVLFWCEIVRKLAFVDEIPDRAVADPVVVDRRSFLIERVRSLFVIFAASH